MSSIAGGAIAAAGRALDAVAMVANAAGTLVVLALVVVVNFDVVARGVFHAPFLGAYEVVQFSMVMIVFLQLPDVVRVNRLTRSDGLLLVLGARRPRFGRTLRGAIDLLSAVLMGLIAITVYPDFVKMFQTKDYFGVPGIFTAPWWPIKLIIVLSAGLCALLFLFKIVRPKPSRSDPIAEPEA